MRHAAGGGWEAVELDYAGRELSMLLVLPDADLAAVEGTIISSWPGAEQFDSAHVRLSVPRWDIETSASLQDALSELGMPLAFTGDADFSGMTMTTEEQLDISDVVHQANITVDEDGTEAAAATAVVMEMTSAPADERTLTFDRPFLFAVRETATGAILFQGRVADPSATR
jgi:serpin B